VQENLCRIVAERKIGFRSDGSFGVPPTDAEIREELGLTIHGLRRIIYSDKFAEIYGEIIDMLAGRNRMDAFKKLSNEMVASVEAIIAVRDDPKTPPSIRLNAAKTIIQIVGVDNLGLKRVNEDDELREFLRKGAKLEITINTSEKKEEPPVRVIDGSPESFT